MTPSSCQLQDCLAFHIKCKKEKEKMFLISQIIYSFRTTFESKGTDLDQMITGKKFNSAVFVTSCLNLQLVGRYFHSTRFIYSVSECIPPLEQILSLLFEQQVTIYVFQKNLGYALFLFPHFLVQAFLFLKMQNSI